MTDRDVDVNLNVQVQGEKDVNSLNASLSKLGAAAKGATTSAGASLDKMAKQVSDERASAKQAVRLLYASHKGENIGSAIRTVLSKVASVVTKTANVFSRKRAEKEVTAKAPGKVKKAADKGADQLDSIRRSVKGLSIAGTVAASIYVLKSALQALGTVGRLITAPFRMLYNFMETTFNYTKDYAERVLQIAPQAARAHVTLAQAMTDSAAGTALLGKAYDSLNEKAVETYKKMGLKERQYTKPGGAIASMLDLTQYIAGRYGDLETKLAQAKTPKAKKLAEKMLTNYRDLMVKNLPAEVANIAMTIGRGTISQFRQQMKFLSVLYRETGPSIPDKQLRQQSAQMTLSLAEIGQHWQEIKDGIARWSIEPINRLLTEVKAKMEAIGPALKDLAGTISMQAWNTLTEAVKSIDVGALTTTLKGWARDIKGLDPKQLGQDIGTSLSKIGNAILQVINWLIENAPKLAHAAELIGNVAAQFGPQTPQQKQTKADTAAWIEAPRDEADIVDKGLRKLFGPNWTPSKRISAGFGGIDVEVKPDKDLQAGLNTAATNLRANMTGAMHTGSDEAYDRIVAAFTAGGAQIEGAISKGLSGAHITVSGVPSRGGDTPAPP